MIERPARFFVSGLNKSGTTFLQMLLDAHPKIVCPSEQHFKTLFESLPKLSGKYSQTIEYFDTVTSNQGTRFQAEGFADYLLNAAIDYLFAFAVDENTALTGLHDNSIIHNIERLATIVPGAKYVFIIRDPRDVGISLWYHNMRVSDKFAESGQNINATVKVVSKRWRELVGAKLAWQEKHPELVYIVRYEDLIGGERAAQLGGLLEFLKTDNSDDVIKSMFDVTDFDKLKAKQAKKDSNNSTGSFFRAGKKGDWRNTLNDETKQHVVAEAKEMLDCFGFPLE